jgi:spore coat protein SA
MIYDLLPEMEPFSIVQGGAISKVVANLMRLDSSRRVACPSQDGSWGFEGDRTIVIPQLETYNKLRGKRHLPEPVKAQFYRWAYRPLLDKLGRGDVVWCHNQPHAAAALAPAVRSAGAALVYHSHDRHVPSTSVEALEAITPNARVFASDALRQQYLERFPHWPNTHVIHNGADESIFFPASSAEAGERRPAVVIYVGRLHEEKGTHVLVEAMRILNARKVEAVCRIVGSSFAGGSKPTAYVKELERASPANVTYLGYRAPAEVAQEFRKADVLCCPSICEEGFGSVNIEAMACGLPVVATRIGGIPEIAEEGGIKLVEPGNAAELADALQILIEDEQLRATMGAQGRRSFQQRFTWKTITQKHQELIASL